MYRAVFHRRTVDPLPHRVFKKTFYVEYSDEIRDYISRFKMRGEAEYVARLVWEETQQVGQLTEGQFFALCSGE